MTGCASVLRKVLYMLSHFICSKQLLLLYTTDSLQARLHELYQVSSYPPAQQSHVVPTFDVLCLAGLRRPLTFADSLPLPLFALHQVCDH